ncbi:MAG: DUF2938 domain-containing protein [Myxococcaceae bacterium]|nr:DUF2938 domain-containing protein [Myxococcaceae bacterium]
MRLELASLLPAVPLGLGATAVMDVWGAALRRLGVPSLEPAMLGRWVGHLGRGTFRHVDIRQATPVRHERALGLVAHYAIGVTFAGLLLVFVGADWLVAPTLAPALLLGVVTVVAPWFILQPGLGAGVASSKTKTPVFNALKSLVTHTVFGLGLYLAAEVGAALRFTPGALR